MKLLKTTKLLSLLVTPLLATEISAHGNDDPLLFMANLDHFEQRVSSSDGDDGPVVLDAQAWLGYDLHKARVKTELEQSDNEFEHAEIQLLYNRAISAFWNMQYGLKHDFEPTPDQTWAAIGLQGLAPYFYDVGLTAFVADSGQSALRLEAEYELMLTQRWLIKPELEADVFGQNDEQRGIGAGLSKVEMGLRLAYEYRREFAPFMGVVWEKSFGNTLTFEQAEGHEEEEFRLVFGLHAWF
jgi:copper resistance protein B